MAQAGFTPIITYHSTTPAAVPSNANLAPGELSVNIADMKLYTENSSGTVTLLASADAAAGNFTTVDTTNLEVTNIKAKDGTAAATIADSTGKITVSTELDVDNLNFSGNAIISTNTDGNIDLTPNGTGEVNITKVDIDGGTIDGTTIGGSTAAAGTFTDVTLNAQGDVRFADSDSSNWVAFQAPATIASNITWTLPNADGTNGQALVTDGSGTLSWATATGGGGGGTAVTVTQITATASQTTFNVTYTVGQLSVYLNGALLASADYTATNGTTVVLAAGAAANDIFTAVAYSTVAGLDIESASPFMTAVGSGAGAVNTGAGNTFVGFEAGNDNTTGNQNVAVGYQAFDANTTGSNNTAIGRIALTTNTSGQGNTALGSQSLVLNVTGSNNTAVGGNALYSNTASNNTAVGYEALIYNTTGTNNVAVGYQALFGVSGNAHSNNTAIGYQAMLANTTGANNTAVGYKALDANTTGDFNTAVGSDALGAATTARFNAAFGADALLVNTTGSDNTALGVGALRTNTTAGNNTAVGRAALFANTTGADNTAVGYQALDACTTGVSNTTVGRDAGGSITTGNENTCLGRLAGQHGGNPVTTGGGNTYVGYAAGSSANNVNAEMVIFSGFAGTTGKGSNTGFINPNGGGVYNGGNTTTWTTTSDQRLKKNIVDNTEGLEKIIGIRVRNFEYRLPEEVDGELQPSDAVIKSGVQLGVIAQELQEVCPDCVTEQSTGVLSVDTDEIFWHMVNAIKQLKAEVDSLKSQINGA